MKNISGKLHCDRFEKRPFISSRIALMLMAVTLHTVESLSASIPLKESTGSSLTIHDTKVGFSGTFMVGKWTALQVEFSSDEPVQIFVETIDSDGLKVRFPSEWSPKSASGKQSRTVFFQAGRLDAGIRAILETESGAKVEKIVHLSGDDNSEIDILKQSAYLILTLGNPAGFENMPEDVVEEDASGVKRYLTNRFRVVELGSVAKLPLDPRSYDAVHSLILADGFDLSKDRSEALKLWVANGGHLVVCAGGQIDLFLPANQLSDPKTENRKLSPLVDWLPAKFVKTEMFSNLYGMEAFTGRTIRLRVDDELRIGVLQNPEVEEHSQGVVLANSRLGPIMIKKPYGFGQVTVTGVDFTKSPIKSWSLRALVAGKILGFEIDKNKTSAAKSVGRLTHSGVTDMKSQLIGALDYFPESRRFSAWFAMGLLVAYTIFLGPIDYLIVHRVLRKPHWTWVTFPSLVLASCSLTLWMGYSGKSSDVGLNKFEILDIDATRTATDSSSLTPTRSHSWYVILSPETQRLKLQLEKTSRSGESGSNSISKNRNDRLLHVELVSSGIPESSFGGMYRQGGLELGLPSYSLATRSSEIPELPMAKWSTKSLKSSWSEKNVSLVSSNLLSQNLGQLKGTFSHSLSGPIEDWVIFFNKRVFLPQIQTENRSTPNAILPGTTLDLGDSQLRAKDIQGYLNQTTSRAVETDKRLGTTETILEKQPYNPLSRDLFQFVRMLSFYKMAGGKSYTGLENNSLRHLEMHEAIKMNQAVLIGRLRSPLSRLRIANDGTSQPIEESQQDTFVRIILPVKIVRPKS